MKRLYALVQNGEKAKHGQLIAETEEGVPIIPTVKRLKMLAYWLEYDLPDLPDGTPQVYTTICYETVYAPEYPGDDGDR